LIRRCAIAVLALGSALAGLAPAAANAYVIGGKRWPTETIRYYAATADYAGDVTRAARIWNRANVGVRFARTSKRSRADVVIGHGGPACAGVTTMGYRSSRSGATVVRLGAGCTTRLVELSAVHELGHVLGLDHERRKCARMNPIFTTAGTPNRCRPHSLGYWLTRPLEPDDVRGARALYQRV
jgi:predicted Zn-dependent protease